MRPKEPKPVCTVNPSSILSPAVSKKNDDGLGPTMRRGLKMPMRHRCFRPRAVVLITHHGQRSGCVSTWLCPAASRHDCSR